MSTYTVKVDAATRSALGDIRSDFLELAFQRFQHLKDRLQQEKSAAIRLLLLKEIFSIFDEMNAIQDVRANFQDPAFFDPIFELITFVRNVLLHFPLFDNWNLIYISAEIGSELMPQKKGGQIAKYLDNNFGKADLDFNVEFSDQKFSTAIKLSAIKQSPDLTYLKDIVSEDDVITLIIEIIQHLYIGKGQVV